MTEPTHSKFVSAVFITFSGDCKRALTFYQTCFGGTLQFDRFEKELPGCTGMPVVIGSLVSNRIVIYGSDLVHNEGRVLGNYMSIFLPCENTADRRALIGKLKFNRKKPTAVNDDDLRLVEVTDAFDVRWVLGV